MKSACLPNKEQNNTVDNAANWFGKRNVSPNAIKLQGKERKTVHSSWDVR